MNNDFPKNSSAVHYFTHADISCEVRCWGIELDEKLSWAYYLYVNNKSAQDSKFQKYFWLEDADKYYNAVFAELSWHCGITYYSQIEDNGWRYTRMGCDYQHYWDEGREYDFEYVKRECEKTAEEMAALIARL